MSSSSRTLGPEELHALSNHFSVILGFVELLLADTPPAHPRHADLLEIRSAAVQAAMLLGRPIPKEGVPKESLETPPTG